jgi:hypothetical protein
LTPHPSCAVQPFVDGRDAARRRRRTPSALARPPFVELSNEAWSDTVREVVYACASDRTGRVVIGSPPGGCCRLVTSVRARGGATADRVHPRTRSSGRPFRQRHLYFVDAAQPGNGRSPRSMRPGRRSRHDPGGIGDASRRFGPSRPLGRSRASAPRPRSIACRVPPRCGSLARVLRPRRRLLAQRPAGPGLPLRVASPQGVSQAPMAAIMLDVKRLYMS